MRKSVTLCITNVKFKFNEFNINSEVKILTIFHILKILNSFEHVRTTLHWNKSTLKHNWANIYFVFAFNEKFQTTTVRSNYVRKQQKVVLNILSFSTRLKKYLFFH